MAHSKKAFHEGCEKMQPYLYTRPPQYEMRHAKRKLTFKLYWSLRFAITLAVFQTVTRQATKVYFPTSAVHLVQQI